MHHSVRQTAIPMGHDPVGIFDSGYGAFPVWSPIFLIETFFPGVSEGGLTSLAADTYSSSMEKQYAGSLDLHQDDSLVHDVVPLMQERQIVGQHCNGTGH